MRRSNSRRRGPRSSISVRRFGCGIAGSGRASTSRSTRNGILRKKPCTESRSYTFARSLARVIANPGCFSSAAILGLAPLAKAGLIDLEHIVVDGMSGTAGAGAELHRAAHHPEIGNNIVAYNVVGHRHTFEMEQELGLVAGKPVKVHFTPTYVPIVRGILDVCHAFPTKPVKRDQLLEIYREFYAGQPFVLVYDLPKDEKTSWQYKPYPWVNSVAGTNYAYVGLDVDEKRGRIVVFSALDSIGKGGAQVGVENMNLMFGLPRTTGLARRGMHPL